MNTDDLFIYYCIMEIVGISVVDWYFNSRFSHITATDGLLMRNGITSGYDNEDTFWMDVSWYRINGGKG